MTNVFCRNLLALMLEMRSGDVSRAFDLFGVARFVQRDGKSLLGWVSLVPRTQDAAPSQMFTQCPCCHLKILKKTNMLWCAVYSVR